MKDYIGENESILQEWECFNSEREENPNFAPDGILYKGEIYNEVGYCERYQDKEAENKLWNDAPIRYLFITKDQNAEDEDAWDVRSETARREKESGSIPLRFYRNLLYVLYGLTHTSTEAMCGYEDFTNEQAIKTYDTEAIARINVKKQAGGASIGNDKLQEYLERDKNFILRQITCLDADVIVCCGYSDNVKDSGNLILNFLNKNGYKFEAKVNDYIYYDSNKNKIAINAWHLSYRGIKQKDFFEGIISAYYTFISENQNFLESHRIDK